jgi:hypothetical protein
MDCCSEITPTGALAARNSASAFAPTTPTGAVKGWLAESLRGRCAFSYGNTLDLGRPLTSETAMTGFVVFAPAVLDREDFLGIDVSPDGHEGHDLINIAGCYPIHQVESRFIRENGLEAFWKSEWDIFDVTRPPAV